MFKAVTNDIEVCVETFYQESKNYRHSFAYRITIKNNGINTVMIQSRFWLITYSDGSKIKVVGEGVVGKTPTLNPGTYFTYTSGCVIETPIGKMNGHYIMIQSDNSLLKVDFIQIN